MKLTFKRPMLFSTACLRAAISSRSGPGRSDLGSSSLAGFWKEKNKLENDGGFMKRCLHSLEMVERSSVFAAEAPHYPTLVHPSYQSLTVVRA